SEAAGGGISSGNGRLLIDGAPSARKIPDTAHSVLFSGESLFAPRFRKKFLAAVSQRRDAKLFDEFYILLFIRNPIEHLSSTYQQGIKRQGFTKPIDIIARSYAHPEKVRQFLELMQGAFGAKVTIRNYSVIKHSVLQATTDWLGIDGTRLRVPDVKQVNRSMTFGELVLLQSLNEVSSSFGGKLLADRLCEELPDIKSDTVRPTLQAQQQLWKRLRPAIDRVNAMMDDPEHHYQRDIAAGIAPSDQEFRFSRSQLQVIARALGGEIKSLREEKSIRFAASWIVNRLKFHLFGGKL
ncbi:MAG: hypothetical protein OEL78_03650, partial [Hyphomicrobiales bacterium]|nr:hypothetical protein [Hyphomicrobiales bacterium]